MSSELERRLNQLGIDSKPFADLEEEFQKVIKELSGDASMERFRREFEKLHKALEDSNEREKELIKACRQAADSILHETVGMDSIARITQEGDNKIRHFQTELENAQKYIRAGQEAEASAQEEEEFGLHEH